MTAVLHILFQSLEEIAALNCTQPLPAEAGRLLSRLEVAVTLKRYSKYSQIYVHPNGYRYSY